MREKEPSRAVRPVFLGLGIFFVALGYVGVVVPVMPSTIFFILALWAFERSSPKFETWLLTHPVFGPTLRDWRKHGAIRPRTKVIAISMVWLSILASTYVVVSRGRPVWVPIMLIGIAFALTWYIGSRRSAVGESDAADLAATVTP